MRGPLNGRIILKLVVKLVLTLHALHLWKRPLTPALSPDGGEGDFCGCVHLSHPPHQFFVTRMPNNRGSVRNTLVVKPLSSLFRKSPVMAVTLNTFLR